MSNNGSIIELVSKGDLDYDLSSKESSLFNYDFINKKKKNYAKFDTLFYPEGRTNWNNTIRFTIERKGDLLFGLYLVIKLPKLSISNLNVTPKPNEYDTNSNYRIKYSDYIGNVMIKKVSLYINNKLVDEQTGEYMQLYNDLYMNDINRKTMIGLDDAFNRPNLKVNPEYIYVPLKFWFCQDTYDPLPMIALQYSEIYIDVTFKSFQNCISILEYDINRNKLYHTNYTHPEVPLEEAFLQANFYNIDADERIKLSNAEYEIPIIQSQVRTINMTLSASLELNFNHIVKDIIFFIQPYNNKNYGENFNFSSKMLYLPMELLNTNIDTKLWDLEPKRHLLYKARLLLNGVERIQWRDYKYFYFMQNHENYRTNIQNYIYMYSFNMHPVRNTNFTGCNFSRIDNAQLQVEIKPNPFILNQTLNIKYPIDNNYELKCYATNYNILIIKNGLASVKYSN
jgi:hypothetical protein